tara:strand:+ start:977 stop:2008 length:1032 start_codon:yes stop_codon:yes gene_type:complete
LELEVWFSQSSWFLLMLFFSASIAGLAKSADILVDSGVNLSLHWRIPKIIIGATILSIGSTLPEVVVSVLAAIQGKPAIALGNAVGSIICDTGLILGVACLVGKIPLDPKIVNRQGWIQLALGFLLVFGCMSSFDYKELLTQGGNYPQGLGGFFLFLFLVYTGLNIYWAKKEESHDNNENNFLFKETGKSTGNIFVTIFLMFIVVAISSEILILTASEMSLRLGISQSIIAVTIVALGTSLPELVTAIIAVKKGHGEIALGNIIGADILNVLLVSAGAAVISSGGLAVEPLFFSRSFPIMLALLIYLRLAISFSKDTLNKRFAFGFIGLYILMVSLNIAEVLS